MNVRKMALIVISMIAISLFSMTSAHSQKTPFTAGELLETTALKAHVEALRNGDST